MFHSLCSDISVYFYKDHDFPKQIIVSFVKRLHRILLNSGKFVRTLKLKTEDEGILKKEIIIFVIFFPPHYPSKTKGYSQLLQCEAPKCDIYG